MLNTEKRNERTTHIDRMSTAEMMAIMQEEYVNAAKAVEPELPAIEAAVDAITARMREGGRLFYMGCGTSGRLGVLDAAECPPTYGIEHGIVVGIIAGGDGAIRRAVEGAEDVDALREARTLFEGYELLLSLTLSDDHIEQTRCAFNDCIIYTDEGEGVEAETAKYRLICLLEQIKRYSGINPSSIF